jgi:tetratricopeptide (TPR) repeat protein
MMHELTTFSRRGAALLGLGVALTALAPARQSLALSQEERRFADFLIRELRYFDTAERWLEGLGSERRLSREDRAEIASRRIDMLQAKGDEAGVRAALEKFAKDFPEHQRASLGSLETIGIDFKTAVEQLLEAAVAGERQKAEALRSRAIAHFQRKVRAPLDELIKELGAQADDDAKKQVRNQTELARLKMFLGYAKALPLDSKERQEVLGEGLKLAESFVLDRFEYPVMQYDGLIQKGIFLLELGRQVEAADELSILYDIAPPSNPPYPPVLVTAFRTLRLQAILFGTRGLNGARAFEEASKVISNHILRVTKDPLGLSNAEQDPDLRTLAVLVRLEYAIALTGKGQSREGLDVIHRIIEKYSGEQQGQAFVIDARKALGRIAAAGSAALAGRDYYQAGVGLKSEYQLGAALEVFQAALAAMSPSEVPQHAPPCLNEIGEISFILERYEESALAYAEFARSFAQHELISKVSTHFLAAVTKAQQSRPDGTSHAGLAELRREAQAIFDREGTGWAVFQTVMIDARSLYESGRYEAARRKYLEVPASDPRGGGKVPFYWRAQASGWMCVVRAWEDADSAGKAVLEPEIDKAVVELGKIIPAALRDKDLAGAAVAALTLGQIRYQREEWQEAAATLRIFTAELAEDTTYRCPALGYLVLSAVKLNDGAAADSHFKALESACKDEPATATAAFVLSEHHTAAGDLKKAAVLMLIYADHPSSAEDMQKLPLVMKTAAVLIDGGLISEARRFLEAARTLPGAEADLERQLLVMEAKILEQGRNWAGAIQKLDEYVAKYKAEGQYYDDPYVWRSLAEAHLKSAGDKPTTAAYLKADQYYGYAVTVLKNRLGEPPDERLAAEYWSWAYRWMLFKYRLGAADRGYYGQIYQFVNELKHTEMGGPEHKQKFLALMNRALQNLGKAEGGRARTDRS